MEEGDRQAKALCRCETGRMVRDELVSVLCVSVCGFGAELEPCVETPCGSKAPRSGWGCMGVFGLRACGCVAFLSVLQLIPAGPALSFTKSLRPEVY